MVQAPQLQDAGVERTFGRSRGSTALRLRASWLLHAQRP